MNSKDVIARMQKAIDVDADGLWGPASTQALENWEQFNGVDFFTRENLPPPPTQPAMIFNPDYLWGQADPRWGTDLLGTKPMRTVGCGIAASAIACSIVTKQRIDPGSLNEWLRNNNGYTGDTMNIVKWSSIAEYVNSFWNIKVKHAFGISEYAAVNYLADGIPVLCYVDYADDLDDNPDHFVCLLAYNDDDGYTFADPATTPASIETFVTSKRHGGYTPQRFDAFVPA